MKKTAGFKYPAVFTCDSLSSYFFPPKSAIINRTYVYATNATAIPVSTNTAVLSAGTGLPILARHAIVCFVAIALITNGKVKAAMLG